LEQAKESGDRAREMGFGGCASIRMLPPLLRVQILQSIIGLDETEVMNFYYSSDIVIRNVGMPVCLQ
jgi:hypothetical protein